MAPRRRGIRERSQGPTYRPRRSPNDGCHTRCRSDPDLVASEVLPNEFGRVEPWRWMRLELWSRRSRRKAVPLGAPEAPIPSRPASSRPTTTPDSARCSDHPPERSPAADPDPRKRCQLHPYIGGGRNPCCSNLNQARSFGTATQLGSDLEPEGVAIRGRASAADLLHAARP